MNHHVTDTLRDEVERFQLKHTCGDCAHGRDLRGDTPSGCALGYDTSRHRDRRVEMGDTLVFCKHFELW